MQKQSTALSYL